RPGAPGLAVAEHIPGRDTALLHGIVPVLGATPGPRDRVVEICNIARGVDPGIVSLKILIDEDAIIQRYAAVAEKADLRVNPDADRNELARHNFATFRYDGFDPHCAAELLNTFPVNQLHAACPIIFSEESGDFGRAELVVQQFFFGNQSRMDPT